MSVGLSERLVNRLAGLGGGTGRRGFLGGAALVGAALATDPVTYLTRPVSAYSTVCGPDSACADGYTVFCCTINNGNNSCPPNSFIGGWWKADHSSYCGGAARYYIDCNAYRATKPPCRCNDRTCDQRRVSCNQFRYGQCNTQIPWSETGPVLCRVVSCTPPWQQYGGVCTSSSATDNRTAEHNAPCLQRSVPIGVVDQISVSGDRVRVRGWTFDPDSPATSIQISIHEDARGVGHFPTGRSRPDVNRAYGISGNHGFDVTFTARPGTHVYTVYGLDVDPGVHSVIGSRKLRIARPPVGQVDHLKVAAPRSVRARGWAFDPDNSTPSIKISIHEDDRIVGHFDAALSRPDVNRAYGLRGSHGFDVTFAATPGRHVYTVYGLDFDPGVHTIIGRAALEVPA
jgi:hypothetical protein